MYELFCHLAKRAPLSVCVFEFLRATSSTIGELNGAQNLEEKNYKTTRFVSVRQPGEQTGRPAGIQRALCYGCRCSLTLQCMKRANEF